MKDIQKNSFDTFADLFMSGLDGLVKAAKLAVEETAKDPEWPEQAEAALSKVSPMITASVIRGAFRYARALPALAFDNRPGPKLLAKCPMPIQEKYAASPVEVLISKGESLLVEIGNLTDLQAQQVLGKDGPRTLAAQRAWLESRAVQQIAAPARSNLPYRITGRDLVVIEPCKLSRKELAKILAELD